MVLFVFFYDSPPSNRSVYPLLNMKIDYNTYNMKCKAGRAAAYKADMQSAAQGMWWCYMLLCHQSFFTVNYSDIYFRIFLHFQG